MNRLLEQKLVLVTGAGGGLGVALAKGLAAQGARLVLVDRTAEGAQTLAKELRGDGIDVETYQLDVTDRSAVATLAERVMDRHGGLDVLINNAGIAGRAAFDTPEAVGVWDRVIAVNLEGVFNVSHAFVPALKNRRGNVVHICSVAGFVAGGSTAGYVVSKGAVKSLTQVMARDLSPHGIRVNAIAPGIIMTEMARAQLTRPGGTDWFMNRVMMARIGEPDEVVGPVVFLASSMASYVTGTTLPVDGGFLAA